MTSPEGRCEVRQAHYLMFATLEFMRQSPFANSWAFIDPCVPGLCPSQLFVEVFSDPELFSAWCLNCFPLGCPVREGIRGWLSSVGAVGSWTLLRGGHGGRRGVHGPCERGLAPGTCACSALGLRWILWPLPRDCISLIKLLLECN